MAVSFASQAIFAAPAETVVLAGVTPQATVHDSHRTWLWWFLAMVAASQLYFVRELFAAFALFAIAFAVIAFVVASLYMLIKCGELALARLTQLRQPVLHVSRVPGGSQP